MGGGIAEHAIPKVTSLEQHDEQKKTEFAVLRVIIRIY